MISFTKEQRIDIYRKALEQLKADQARLDETGSPYLCDIFHDILIADFGDELGDWGTSRDAINQLTEFQNLRPFNPQLGWWDTPRKIAGDEGYAPYQITYTYEAYQYRINALNQIIENMTTA